VLLLKFQGPASGIADCLGRVRDGGWPGSTRSAPGGAADRDGLRSRRWQALPHDGRQRLPNCVLAHACEALHLSALMRSICCALKERLGSCAQRGPMLSRNGRLKPSRRDLPGGPGMARRSPGEPHTLGMGVLGFSVFVQRFRKKWRTPCAAAQWCTGASLQRRFVLCPT
jgi:hypothetical protein